MPATQVPVLDNKNATTSGAQLFTSADLDSGFLADAGAQDSTKYRLWFRCASSNVYIGPSGHGGGGGDYNQLIKIGTTDYEWPDFVRREDLEDFYAYATGPGTIATYIRAAKVVAS
jgi:hypothetical protein